MQPRDIIAADPKFSETRKVSLYSNFERLRETNQYGYDANIATWRAALLRCVSEGCFDNKTMLDTSNLVSELADPTSGTPRALNFVIDDMVARRDLVPLQTWCSSKTPILRSTWSVSAVTSWAWRQVFPFKWSSGKSGTLKPEQYVSVEVVKRVAETLYKKLQAESTLNGSNMSSKVIGAESLGASLGLSTADLEACVVYLSREQNKPIAFDSANNFVVLERQVTEEHRTIAQIRFQIAILDKRSETLQARVAKLEADARTAVKAKQTAVAKQKLRTKKEAEDSLTKTIASSSKLESILSSVDTASDQAGVLEAFEASAKLLKTVNSAVGSPDKVADLVDSINEQMADTEEMGNELARVHLSGDANDVEDELEALEAEVKGDKLEQRLGDLKAPSKPLAQPEAKPEAQPQPAEAEAEEPSDFSERV